MKRKDLTADNTSADLKFVATVLNYPYLEVVPVDRVNTYYLRGGESNSLYLAGYINRDIKKWGDGKGKL